MEGQEDQGIPKQLRGVTPSPFSSPRTSQPSFQLLLGSLAIHQAILILNTDNLILLRYLFFTMDDMPVTGEENHALFVRIIATRSAGATKGSCSPLPIAMDRMAKISLVCLMVLISVQLMRCTSQYLLSVVQLCAASCKVIFNMIVALSYITTKQCYMEPNAEKSPWLVPLKMQHNLTKHKINTITKNSTDY